MLFKIKNLNGLEKIWKQKLSSYSGLLHFEPMGSRFKEDGFKMYVLYVHKMKGGCSNGFLGQMYTGLLMRSRSNRRKRLFTYWLIKYS